ncbi:hypothetical protein AAFN86_14795 [Roseomonas sp. CAU 1739]|uniref:hypothetical protein n=1 Tax=Roseomonas sp. CAU 1739 TaxID=3140364 RepID=UPI00325B09EA
MTDSRPLALALSAAELAGRTGTSDATVVRTVKALGFNGLSDLKRALAEAPAAAPTDPATARRGPETDPDQVVAPGQATMFGRIPGERRRREQGERQRLPKTTVRTELRGRAVMPAASPKRPHPRPNSSTVGIGFGLPSDASCRRHAHGVTRKHPVYLAFAGLPAGRLHGLGTGQ